MQFCSLQGLSGDQITYATQASECAFLVCAAGLEIKAEILPENLLPENLLHTDYSMLLAFDSVNAQILSKFASIDVRFEVKHSYFNNLHDAVESLSSMVITRLMPKHGDIKSFQYDEHFRFQTEYNVIHLEDGNQLQSLQLLASCPNSNPPFLVTGACGTGKTRLLAAAAHHFLQKGRHSKQPVRVLVCAHHQASADTFIERYFGVMIHDAKYPWREHVVRVTSKFYCSRNDAYAHLYMNHNKFCKRFRQSHVDYIVVVTTFPTSLHFRGTFGTGYFTHILLDEAALTMEPEAIAPLCLANKNTKIVLAGDCMQVHAM